MEDVLFACQSDGYHQNERGRADDHAQRGEHDAYFVGAEAIDRQAHDLAQHHGPLCAGERAFEGSAADTADGGHEPNLIVDELMKIPVWASFAIIPYCTG